MPLSKNEIKALRAVDQAKILSCMARAPYDGCFHEDNFWFVSGTGTIHPLYYSGRIEALLGKRDQTDQIRHGVPLEAFVSWLEADHSSYTDFELEEVRECSIPFNLINSVRVILRTFFDAVEEDLPTVDCDHCGTACAGQIHFLGYSGNGGVGIELDTPCCEACFERLRWCDTCMRIVEPGDDAEGKPCCRTGDRAEPHALYTLEDEAERYDLSGAMVPPGGAEGPSPIVVIWQKR